MHGFHLGTPLLLREEAFPQADYSPVDRETWDVGGVRIKEEKIRLMLAVILRRENYDNTSYKAII